MARPPSPHVAAFLHGHTPHSPPAGALLLAKQSTAGRASFFLFPSGRTHQQPPRRSPRLAGTTIKPPSVMPPLPPPLSSPLMRPQPPLAPFFHRESMATTTPPPMDRPQQSPPSSLLHDWRCPHGRRSKHLAHASPVRWPHPLPSPPPFTVSPRRLKTPCSCRSPSHLHLLFSMATPLLSCIASQPRPSSHHHASLPDLGHPLKCRSDPAIQEI